MRRWTTTCGPTGFERDVTINFVLCAAPVRQTNEVPQLVL